MALVKHNNNSISAVTSMASLTTGAMTLIKEQTASSSASISFVDGSSDVVLDSTYPIYKFEFINIHAGTDRVKFQFQGSTDGGSNYNTTMTTTYFNAYHTESDSGTPTVEYNTGQDDAQSTSFSDLIPPIGIDNDNNAVGYLHLFNPSSTTFVKHFISNMNHTYVTSSNTPYTWQGFKSGYFNSTSAIDSIQFKMSSGNIDSGDILLYGVN
jgi:hypothetical protein